MKPFITPEILVSGKKLFSIQYEGIYSDEIWKKIGNKNIVSYSMLQGHSLRAAWLFRLVFQDDFFIEFSSASTEIMDWQEVGSLNIRFSGHSAKNINSESFECITTTISSIQVAKLEKVLYSDPDLVVECGVIIHGDSGEEIIVSAGIPPGSVSISAPFGSLQFEPQFDMSDCTRTTFEMR